MEIKKKRENERKKSRRREEMERGRQRCDARGGKEGAAERR